MKICYYDNKWCLVTDDFSRQIVAKSTSSCLFGQWNNCLVTIGTGKKTWWVSNNTYFLMFLLLLVLLFPYADSIYNSFTWYKTIVMTLFVCIVSSIVGFI